VKSWQARSYRAGELDTVRMPSEANRRVSDVDGLSRFIHREAGECILPGA